MLYKAILTGAVIFLREESAVQVIMAFTIAALMAFLTVHVHAFAAWEQDALHIVTTACRLCCV